MHTQQIKSTTFVAIPAPDDSDFLDSGSERDANESIAEQNVEDYTQGIPSASQRTYQGSPMSEMEAELAAVATPTTSQTTSTSYFTTNKRHPKPATKIMQMTSTFSFTYFADPAPQADLLNENSGRQAAGLFLPGEQPAQHLARLNRLEHIQKDAAPISKIAPHLAADTIVHWFNIDSELVYLSFFDDWGPLNVAMFYRFCLHLHHLIGMMQDKAAAAAKPQETPSDTHLILYTTNVPRPKANAALLAAMYAMVCGEMTPADAFHPLSELELVPFRDAGYGRADFYLTIQDILYGVHRAMTENLLDLMTFDLDEYETYEQVQNGDWNWITPNIIAFASPNDRDYVAELRKETVMNEKATPALKRPLNASFTKTIQYFKEKNIKLVVRLNNPLYDSRVFEREGIEHVDMYFDDGSNPCEEIVREFIQRADAIISAGGAIAVHCKAGLGRTGVLIGAYLAYRHGFTASESIGFMRIMRPGCVVGPQQHFMYKEACNWMRWREQDDAKKELQQALEKHKKEMVGSRRRKSDELEGGSSSSSSNNDTDLEVDVGLGDSADSHGRQFKKIKVGPQAPQKPKRVKSEVDGVNGEGQTAMATIVKPAPCVGQPRKSPSPSRKRAAQAQAPATIARMGGLGSSRLMSSGQQRSFSGSSFTRNLQRISQAQDTQENGNQQEQQQEQQYSQASTTPRGSGVLGDAQRINIQISANEGEVAMSTPRGGNWDIAIKSTTAKDSVIITNLKGNEVDSAEDELFVQGWKSPEPPAVYIERMNSSPARPTTTTVLTPSTPTSPSASTRGVRASPQVREKFGLREAGSHQGTPQSRKEAAVIDLPPSLSNGSSNSATSCDTLTSQDAVGSEEEQLCAGPLRVTQKTAASVNASSSSFKPSAVARQTTRPPVTVTSGRIASRERPTQKTTTAAKSRMASNVSTSSRTTSGSSATNRVISNGTRSTTTTTTTTTTVSRKPTVEGAGRVAAVKDQLAQKQANQPMVSSDLVTRPSLKRLRTQSPILGSILDTKVAAAAAASASHSRIMVPPQIASKFGLGVSSIGIAPSAPTSRSIVSAVVPRFATATAASVAKSQHAATENVPRFQRTNSVYSTTTKAVVIGPTSTAAALPPLSLTRLNGRNVRRRRSSIS